MILLRREASLEQATLIKKENLTTVNVIIDNATPTHRALQNEKDSAMYDGCIKELADRYGPTINNTYEGVV